MRRYPVDGVALARYLVDALPNAAADAFRRAEQGIDVLEAPTVTIRETIWATSSAGFAKITPDTQNV